MLPVKGDLVLSLGCLDSARVRLSCQAIKRISVLVGLCQVLANPVTYGREQHFTIIIMTIIQYVLQHYLRNYRAGGSGRAARAIALPHFRLK